MPPKKASAVEEVPPTPAPARPTTAVREIRDPRAIATNKKERKDPAYMKFKFHTIEIPEQEGEQSWVDVCMSGTEKNEQGEEMPVGPLRLWIQRGMPVANVPTWAVHILLDTAVETRFTQRKIDLPDGGKKMAFIPSKKKSYPCTLIESYMDRKDVDDRAPGVVTETMPDGYDE